MKRMIQISAAGNTMAPCWVALEELGYAISTVRVQDTEMWIAEKEGESLQGNDPCMLLGLAKLVELRGEDWQASDGQVEEFLQRFYTVETNEKSAVICDTAETAGLEKTG
jgi:hypothetical protein